MEDWLNTEQSANKNQVGRSGDCKARDENDAEKITSINHVNERQKIR